MKRLKIWIVIIVKTISLKSWRENSKIARNIKSKFVANNTDDFIRPEQLL